MVQMRMQFKRLIRPAIEVTIGLMIGGPLLGVAIIIAWMFPYPYRDARSNAEVSSGSCELSRGGPGPSQQPTVIVALRRRQITAATWLSLRKLPQLWRRCGSGNTTRYRVPGQHMRR